MTDRTAIYRVLQDHAVEGLRLVMRRKLKVPLAPFLILAVGVAAIAMLLPGGSRFGIALPVLAWLLIALAGILAVVHYWVLPRQARRMYSQAKLLKEEVTFAWDDEGYSVTGESSRTRLSWTDLYAWSENENLVLLHQSEMGFNLLPKSVISDAQLNDIRAHLDNAQVKKL
jgi:hypothetical protein